MEQLKQLFNEMNEKPIAYHRVYSKITGSITAGLMLSQILYWAKTMDYKEFYKTDKDFAEELGMSIKEVRTAKNNLKRLGVISIVVKGVPAKTYYSVNMDKVINLIMGQTSLAERDKLELPKGTNKNSRKGQTLYTEITSETKTDILSEQSSQPFNFLKEIEKMKTGKHYLNQIIANYWEYKSKEMIPPENKEQFQAILKRDLSLAKPLKPYSLEQIKATMYDLNSSRLEWSLKAVLTWIDKDRTKITNLLK